MPVVRDEKGRFVKGHPGGPGRPSRDVELEYLAVTQQGCTPQEWLVIVKRAKADAMAGDGNARAFLAKYLLPTPGVEIAVDTGYQGPEMTAADLPELLTMVEDWAREQRAGADLDRFLYASGPPAPAAADDPEPEAPAPREWDSDLYGELDHELLKHSGRRPR